MKELSKATRREFMKKAGALSVMQAATPLAASLSLMNNAAAQTAPDYKALVCVFMYGANDHYGTVVPYKLDLHNAYRKIRGKDGELLVPDDQLGGDYSGIAVLRSKLRTLTSRGSVLDYALHPAMGGMQALFNEGRAGIVMNVGPLIQPTTYLDFKNRLQTHWPLPPNLQSHNNQQAYWQTAVRGETEPTGWGGRMVDAFLADKLIPNASLTCISVTGDALLLSGKGVISTKMSPAGVSTINPLNHSTNTYGNDIAALDMIKALSNISGNHMMTAQYAQVMSRSLATYGLVAGKIGTAPITDSSKAYMPSAHDQDPKTKYNSTDIKTESTPLAEQLEMVARMIEQGPAMGLKRQVFMVGVGGFDLHDNLVSQHPKLLKMVSDACKEFDQAMKNMGLGNNVTTFTASDFGRTLSSNGDGSDHGWGSHHFVLGGAVNGGKFYGKVPDIGLDHSQSIGQGILIPTTSLEQMFVPIAKWFGVTNGHMASVFPNAQNFSTSLDGLMK